MAEGRSNTEICALLFLRTETVEGSPIPAIGANWVQGLARTLEPWLTDPVGRSRGT